MATFAGNWSANRRCRPGAVLRASVAFRSLVDVQGAVHFLRALQAFRFAVLPARYCVTVVESLDATPGEGSDFYRFAQYLGVQLF
jgi:hypothetical protein